MTGTIEAEAEALRLQLQLCAAGQTVAVSWRAASDHLAAIIGYAADDVRDAERLCETAAEDMKSAIRRNWPEIRRARSAPAARGRA